MYIWNTLQNSIGSHSMQTRFDHGSCKDCSNCEFTTTEISAPAASHIGTYMILQKIYKGVCTDHCADGEIAQEGY
jgi:hypothetical protein